MKFRNEILQTVTKESQTAKGREREKKYNENRKIIFFIPKWTQKRPMMNRYAAIHLNHRASSSKWNLSFFLHFKLAWH